MIKKLIYFILIILNFNIISVVLPFSFYKNNIVSLLLYKKDNVSVMKELTEKQKLEDFEYLYDILRENYPYFQIEKERWGGEWLSRKEYFQDKIRNTKNNYEFYKALSEITMSIQNVHTNIISPYNYAEIRDIFNQTDFTPWNNILNNRKVNEKYEQWKDILRDKGVDYVSQSVPVSFYYVQGKYLSYDLGVTSSFTVGIPYDCELLEVDDKPVDDYIKSLREKQYYKYDYVRDKIYVPIIVFESLSSFKIKLKLCSPDGKIFERNLDSSYYNKATYSLTSRSFNDNVDLKKIEEGNIAYVGVNSFDYNNIDKDKDEILNFYREIKNYRNLIIDIRGNGGGADAYWLELLVRPLISEKKSYKFICAYRTGEYIKPFINNRIGINTLFLPKLVDANIEGITEKEKQGLVAEGFIRYSSFNYVIRPSKDSIHFKGNIFLLTDSDIYSSAENFCVFAKATNFATIIGTPTGGDGIGIDPIMAFLPNSGLIFRFPADVGVVPYNGINELKHTFPDIYVEQDRSNYYKKLSWDKKNKEDNINPYDTVLETTISLCK